MKIPLILFEVNWSNISGNWIEFITDAYTGVLDVWFYPIVFIGLIGYVYAVHKSAIAAAAAITLVFGIFGVTGIFAAPAEFSLMMYVITILSFAALFTTLFVTKYRS